MKGNPILKNLLQIHFMLKIMFSKYGGKRLGVHWKMSGVSITKSGAINTYFRGLGKKYGLISSDTNRN